MSLACHDSINTAYTMYIGRRRVDVTILCNLSNFVKDMKYGRALRGTLNILKVLTKFKRNFTPPDASNRHDVNIYHEDLFSVPVTWCPSSRPGSRPT